MKSVSFILSPRSAGLSLRKPALTGTSHDTFFVQGDDTKKWVVRDTVFIKLIHTFISSTCHGCTHLPCHWPGERFPYSRNQFRLRLRFLCSWQIHRLFAAGKLIRQTVPRFRNVFMDRGVFERCLHSWISPGHSRLHGPAPCLILDCVASCVVDMLLVSELWVCVKVRVGLVVTLNLLVS